MKLDRFDHTILSVLQSDGRISNVDLADRAKLSESACLRRVRALEASGLIKGYVAQVDQAKAGLPVNVFVNITLVHQDLTELKAFEEAVQEIPEVMECYLMSGEHDYVLRVVVADVNDYERIHQRYLTRLPGVARVNSSFALRTVRKTNQLPIG
ncbi:MAG: Lrp/AsnC family transcriptional regulator [Gammaproteobacteria bacterium]|nr:MAG: Lrp/AsnC family transcriptional regulator [Gammaproteobacteria bacterium]